MDNLREIKQRLNQSSWEKSMKSYLADKKKTEISKFYVNDPKTKRTSKILIAKENWLKINLLKTRRLGNVGLHKMFPPRSNTFLLNCSTNGEEMENFQKSTYCSKINGVPI